MKKIIKKLNNYRLTATIVSAVSLIAAVVSLGLLFVYYFAGDISKKTKSRMPSFFNLGQDGRIMGMIFFLACIFVIIISILVIYNLLPAIKNKEKITPRKSPLIIAVVNGVFQVIVLVFSILAITLETPNTLVWYVISLPLTGLTAIANFLCLVPFFKCVFYMPAINKVEEKKPAEEAK